MEKHPVRDLKQEGNSHVQDNSSLIFSATSVVLVILKLLIGNIFMTWNFQYLGM